MVSAGKFSRMKSCFQLHSREWSIQRLMSNIFSFPFAFFSCHPELSRQYFLKLQLSQTVLADNFTEAEPLAGYLFVSQAVFTWLCKCCEQMGGGSVMGRVWLLKYHGQGSLSTCPDHPWLHLSGVLYVGSSAQPRPFYRHHDVEFFITWCFWKSCFSSESMSLSSWHSTVFAIVPHFFMWQ